MTIADICNADVNIVVHVQRFVWIKVHVGDEVPGLDVPDLYVPHLYSFFRTFAADLT